MRTFYHGSHNYFEKFDLSKTGNGTGIRFGFGVYLTESESTAVHYSQPRKQPLAKDHYLYTMEFLAELTDDNHLISAKPVHPAIVKRVEAKLGKPVPEKKTLEGKVFRKWLGLTLTGCKDRCLESEKAAAEFLDSVGVICSIWPNAQKKAETYNDWPEMGKLHVLVFNDKYVRITKIEHIEVFDNGTKDSPHWDLVEGSKKTIFEYK